MTQYDAHSLHDLFSSLNCDLNYLQCTVQQRLHQLNQLSKDEVEQRYQWIQTIVAECPSPISVGEGFWCDFGFNVYFAGEACIGQDCIMYDSEEIHIGQNVTLGDHVCLACSGHSLVVNEKRHALAYAKPICVKAHSVIEQHCTIMGGVTIGRNTHILSGSVVTESIPDNVVASGNPCRILSTHTTDSIS